MDLPRLEPHGEDLESHLMATIGEIRLEVEVDFGLDSAAESPCGRGLGEARFRRRAGALTRAQGGHLSQSAGCGAQVAFGAGRRLRGRHVRFGFHRPISCRCGALV